MDQRKLHIALGIFVASLIGVALTFSTLHSHHNLELHNSKDFADTGQCITDSDILCPICAHLVQSEDITADSSNLPFKVVNKVVQPPFNKAVAVFYIPNKGRSPPVLG